MIVSNSTDPLLVNGVYDAYCLNPLLDIGISPTLYQATNAAGNTQASFVPIGFSSLTQTQVDQLNWLLAQNFTSDARYGGQFNYGEVQLAIWRIVGFTDAQIATYAGTTAGALFLNDNNRNVVDVGDQSLLVSDAQAAIASGHGALPTDAFFSEVIDPDGNVQPLIVQLQSAKLGNYVWLDGNANGIQDAGEAGTDNVIVQLYDNLGNLISSTVTGDDYSTAAVEHGYYQFTGLKAGSYQVKFTAPSGLSLTVQDALGNSQDAADSDANPATGFSQIVALAAGASDQTVDAGLIPLQPASLGDRLWIDVNGDGKQDANHATEPGISGQTVTLIGGGADGLISTPGDNTSVTTTTGADGIYGFGGLTPGVQYQVQFSKPAGTVFTAPNVGANGFDLVDSDADTTTGKTQIVTLASGENNPTLDAGVYTPAKLSGYVYQDVGNDGVRNAEPPIAGVLLTLTGTDGAGNPVTGTTTTDANGFYQFPNLAPGTYTVSETQPAGYLDGKDTAGSTSGNTTVNDVISAIPLVSGANSIENNFGELLTASLGDRLWIDVNGDGKQDANHATEPGISGQTVTLIGGGPDGLISTPGDNTSVTTTTGADGIYGFGGLTPGVQYQVQFSKPAGTVFTAPNVGANGFDLVDSDADTTTGKTQIVTLASGENNPTLDAGVYTPASLGDRVWEDSNGNGQQDSGEPGIGGVTVRLFNCVTNALVATTTTDGSGIYNFAGLPPGTYHVEFQTPNGYLLTTANVGNDASDSDAGAGGITGCYTLNSGDTNTTVDAGLYRPASLGDRLWTDTNGNGKQDAGEAGLPGQLVTLIGGGADGLISTPGDNTSVTTTTGADGIYGFGGLTPGVQYQVQFSKPAGTVFTAPNVGANGFDLVDSDADTTTGKTQIVTLASGENNPTLDAGVYTPASLGDRVWEDSNGNGQQDSGEPGIGGVTVRLFNCVTNALVATTTTDGSGIYNFAGLPPGTYHVEFQTPNGYLLTTANVGNDASDSDAGAGGITGCYTLNSGDTNTTVDAGLYRPASLGDRLWTDTNGNGKQDAGEAGLPGQLVTLIGGGADGLISTPGDNTSVTTTTGADGIYGFGGLTPGVQYQVQFNKPAGTVFTAPNVGANGFDLVDSDADTTTGKTQIVTLASGENNPTLDAGVYTPASLGDRVWEDSNGNGQQDSGEPGIGGVTVRLFNCVTNALVATTTTDGSGIYNFAGLPPGTYHVEFQTPNGYLLTTANVGNDASDSDAGAGGITGCYTLNSGDTNTTVDAGLYRPASLGDRLWTDTNGNGKQDAGEAGLPGQLVTLIGGGPDGLISTPSDNTSVTTTTGADGIYGFGGLTPGVQYQVQFSKPAGTVFTAPNVGANGFDLVDSDADTTTGKTQIVTLASGENNPTLDAGVYTPAKLSGYVYQDVGNDGVRNAEPPIAGVLLTLTGTDGAGNPVTGTTTTDANGFYQFPNLAPGTYTVSETQPAGYLDGKDTAGSTSGNTTVNDVISAIPLVSGANSIENNFGEMVPVTAAIDLIKTARVDVVDCPVGPIGSGADAPGVSGTQSLAGVDLGDLTKFLFYFGNGNVDANWQGATKGFAGDVAVNGIAANERTSGGVPFAGTIYTNDTTLGAWQGIVNQNPSQAFAQTNQTALITGLQSDLVSAFQQINAMPVTPGYASFSSSALNGLNTQNGINEVYVINMTSGLSISSQIKVTGDAGDVFVLRWDTDANFGNGYQGQVKFQSGGAIVPLGGLQPGNFISVAGDMNASGGGSTPASPYPQGPRLDDGQGALIQGAQSFSGGGFFTGYWLSTGKPTTFDPASGLYVGETSPFSNALFVGGWYTLSTKFSMTSGTSGVQVCPNLGTLTNVMLEVDKPFNPGNVGVDGGTAAATIGDLITYTFKATNTGSVALANVKVLDNNATPANTMDDYFAVAVLKANGNNFGDVNNNNLLDPGESWYFQAKDYATATGSFTNMATVTADYLAGQVHDSDIALVGIAP